MNACINVLVVSLSVQARDGFGARIFWLGSGRVIFWLLGSGRGMFNPLLFKKIFSKKAKFSIFYAVRSIKILSDGVHWGLFPKKSTLLWCLVEITPIFHAKQFLHYTYLPRMRSQFFPRGIHFASQVITFLPIKNYSWSFFLARAFQIILILLLFLVYSGLNQFSLMV